MKPIERYVYGGVIVFLICAYFFKGCNKPKEKQYVFTDTSTNVLRDGNKGYDTLHQNYLNDTEKKDKRIAYLEDQVKQKVAKIRWLPAKHDTVFINCEEQLGYAQDAINYYDSLANALVGELKACKTHVEQQEVQVKFNREFAEKAGKDKLELIQKIVECGDYKHIIFRIYRKKR